MTKEVGGNKKMEAALEKDFGLQRCLSCGFKEGEYVKGWDKATVDYAVEHRAAVVTAIRRILNKMRNRNSVSEDDVYMQLLLYLYDKQDYDLDKAKSRKTGQTIGIGAYVTSCAFYAAQRLCSDANYNNRSTIVVMEDGKIKDLGENIEDETIKEDFEEVEYSLKDILSQYYGRHKSNGVDFYSLMYIVLNARKYGVGVEETTEIAEYFNIKSKQFRALMEDNHDSDMTSSIFRAVSLADLNEAIDVFRDFSYISDSIDSVFELYK